MKMKKRKLKECEENDQVSMVNFKNSFKIHEQKRYLFFFYHNECDIEIDFFFSYDFGSFINQNQPSKFYENGEGDVEVEVFDVEILVCNYSEYIKDINANLIEMNPNLNSEAFHEKGAKLDVIS